MIDYADLVDLLRRRVGDTGPVRCWSGEAIAFAIEEAIIAVCNDIPEGHTEISDLAVDPEKNTIELPSHGVVFLRAYGQVDSNGVVTKTLKWISETEITNTDACWRENTGSPTHAVFTEDQSRIWLNGPSVFLIRCAVSTLPNPLIDVTNDLIHIKTSYRNLIEYKALCAMYGLTSNGAGKQDFHENLYLQALDRRRGTNQFNIKNLAMSEK